MLPLVSLRAHSHVCVPAEQRAKNIAGCLSRHLPSIAIGEAKDGPIAVIGGGLSASDELENIKNFKGFRVAINGSHDWLIDNGIIPDAMIAVDPQKVMDKFFKNPQEETTYLVCSHCDPSVFDALEGKRVATFHSQTENSDKGTLTINTGPSAITTAPYLLYVMGYRDIHLFGADSSLSSGQSHAYKDGSVDENRMNVLVGEDVYLTTPQFILQAAHLWDINTQLKDDLNIKIHGYGLSKAIFKSNGNYNII